MRGSLGRSRHAALKVICISQLLLLPLVFSACSSDEGTAARSVVGGGSGGAGGAIGTPGIPGTAGGAPMCLPPQSACGLQPGGVCTDLQSDPRNCGQCGRSCTNGACVGGMCSCPTNLTSCPSGCLDTSADTLNCGMCGRMCAPGEACQQGQCLPPGSVCTPACVGGQVCTNNKCECPAPTSSFCAGACVDTKTTPAHCGACDDACGAGQLCEAGKCVCPMGQMLCGEDCADLQLSADHCGGCDTACGDKETCMAGVCRAPAGADGCTGAPRDLAIREVAAFQTIKVPLSQGVSVIDPAMRPKLIRNRPTLFRVYVAPGSGFMAREFSARVTVKSASGEDQYFAKQRITKASVEAETASTFQVSVPPDRIGADTRYWVELVECAAGAPGATPPTAGTGAAGTGAAGTGAAGTGAAGTGGSGGTSGGGATMGTRFPASGDTPLSAIDTGKLKIRFIPLMANGRGPNTSDAELKVYKDYLLAMYPVDEVVFSVAEPVQVGYPVNWNTVLSSLRSLRQRNTMGTDEYYYGLLRPTETFQQFCRGGCTAGISYIGSVGQVATRVSLGLAYGDEMSAGIMAHEVGHAHGRAHAPCAPGGIASVDSRYPHANANTGVWAYDNRSQKFLNPATTKDIMGYCDPKWISDYTYNALVARSPMVNDMMLVYTDPATVLAYRVALLDASGIHWTEPFPRPDAPFGTPEEADVLDASGQITAKVTVYRTEIADNYGFEIVVPPPQPGWHAIQLQDASPLVY